MSSDAGMDKKWFRIIGAAIIFTGIVLVAFQVGTFLKSDKKGITFNAPGAIEVRVEKPDEYLIFYRYDGEDDEKNGGLNIVVYEKKTKEEIPLSKIIDETVYALKENPWDSMFEFFVDEPTTVIIEANYKGSNGPSLMFKASADFMSKSLPAIVKMTATLIITFLAGGAIFLIPNLENKKAGKNDNHEDSGNMTKNGKV